MPGRTTRITALLVAAFLARVAPAQTVALEWRRIEGDHTRYRATAHKRQTISGLVHSELAWSRGMEHRGRVRTTDGATRRRGTRP
ncbi:MAG: hypothetical protein K8E66_14255 [Phycisphaerales bacterium]|nr:hypothetical protein [Phycisphaerales bacterium]